MPALESNALLIDFNWEGAQGNFLGNRYVLSFDLGGGYTNTGWGKSRFTVVSTQNTLDSFIITY